MVNRHSSPPFGEYFWIFFPTTEEANPSLCLSPPEVSQQVIGDFTPGDVVLFTMHTVHGSTSNCCMAKEPGDSKLLNFFPRSFEVTNNLLKGHVNSPSQKGHNRRIARGLKFWFFPGF